MNFTFRNNASVSGDFSAANETNAGRWINVGVTFG